MTAYQLNEEKMFADIADGVAIVINSETGIYYGMNKFSTAIFEKLTAGFDDEAVFQALKKMPNAPENLDLQYKAFIEKLKSNSLILENAVQNSGDITFDAVLLADDGFTFEVTEYSDAQELLMADPIHEVKETTGWTPEKESIGYSKEETKEREKKVID